MKFQRLVGPSSRTWVETEVKIAEVFFRTIVSKYPRRPHAFSLCWRKVDPDDKRREPTVTVAVLA